MTSVVPVNNFDVESVKTEKNVPNSKEVNEEITANRSLSIGVFDLCVAGIAIVIGGQYFSWNFALAAGFGSCFISVLLVGLAYICLCLCNAEMSSCLPFAGGAYGLARVTLGFYPGFLVGCCESIEYIMYVSSSSISLSLMIISLINISPEFMPVLSLIFYLSAVSINVLGGKYLWVSLRFLGIVSLLILVMFILGSFKYVNMDSNTPTTTVTGSIDAPNQWLIGGMYNFMKILPLAPWFYVGIESLNFCSAIVVNVSFF